MRNQPPFGEGQQIGKFMTVWIKHGEFSMFINEYPHGGYQFDFLDYRPENEDEYVKMYVTFDPPSEIESIKELFKDEDHQN